MLQLLHNGENSLGETIIKDVKSVVVRDEDAGARVRRRQTLRPVWP